MCNTPDIWFAAYLCPFLVILAALHRTNQVLFLYQCALHESGTTKLILMKFDIEKYC
jgi:hypothetical protein